MYPNFIPNAPIINNIPYTMGNMARVGTLARGSGGILAKLGLTGKSINWGGLLNNASKTLGVVNQAIPLVKQAGPMFNNMKSMMRLASIFKDETDPKNQINNPVNNQNNTTSTNTYQYNKPNFFI